MHLLVDPRVNGTGVVDGGVLLAEPESDLGLGGLDGVGTVADVASDVDGEITADGTGGGVEGVGGAKEDTAGLDGVLALEDDADDGAGSHVLDETGEELLALEVLVVLLEVLLGGVDHLEGGDLVTAVLEALDDLTDNAALDAVGLDHDVGCSNKGPYTRGLEKTLVSIGV